MSRYSSLAWSLQEKTVGVIHRRLSSISSRPAVLEAVPAAREIWAYSSAYLLTGDKQCLMMASRANDFFLEHFIDHKNGGVYCSIDSNDERLDTDKKTDTIASCIFCLAQYYDVTKDDATLRQAVNLFELLEKQMKTPDGGYTDLKTRDWSEIKDASSHTACTFMHLLEGYAKLYKVTRDPAVEASLRGLVASVLKECPVKNYGHCLSAAWLVIYVANLLGDIDLLCEVRSWALGMLGKGLEAYSSDPEAPLWIAGEAVIALLSIAKYAGSDKSVERVFSEADKLLTRFPSLNDDMYHAARMTLLLCRTI